MVEFSRLKRQSFKGIVDVVYGGEKPIPVAEQPQKKQGDQSKEQKRKANDSVDGTPVNQSKENLTSKRQQKKNKKARVDG